MRRLIIIAISICVLLLMGCNVAKDTAKRTKEGGKNAVGLAEKMKGGTVGNVDEDTGESNQGDEGQ